MISCWNRYYDVLDNGSERAAFVLQFILRVCHGMSLILMQITITYRIDDYQLSDEAPKKNQTKNRMYNIRVTTNEYFTFQSVKSSILMEFYNYIGGCYVHILIYIPAFRFYTYFKNNLFSVIWMRSLHRISNKI